MERLPPEDTTGPLPREFGTYLLLRQLGHGGMGNVFLAVQRLEIFERLCVIKMIRSRLVGQERHRQRFLDEARTTLALSHRNICSVLDVGVQDGSIYLAMEYVAGRDLRTILKRCASRDEPLPPAIGAFILAETLEALEAAHGHVDVVTGSPLSVVHRDVSPHNVVVGFDGGVKLIDFGVASTTTATAQTDPGLVLGKCTYMAPEQAAAKPVDGRADVFAAAIVGVEMFTARRFYGDMGLDEIVAALEDGRHRPPAFAALPADLRAILDAALAPAPQQRPAARELSASLRAWALATGNVAGAAEVRTCLASLFPGEETSERQTQQEILQGARETATAADLTQSAAVPKVSPATAPSGVTTQTELAAATAVPTAVERKGRTALPGAERTVVTHTARARLKVVPLLGAAIAFASLVLVAGFWMARSRATEEPRSDSAAIAYRAGLAHQLLLEHGPARARFEEAITIEPGHALSYARLAQSEFAMGQFMDAKVAAGRASELAADLPPNARALVDAVQAQAQREWTRAIDALGRRAAHADADVTSLLELARVQLDARRAADAMETLTRLRQRDDAGPALGQLLIVEASAARGLGDLDRSLVAARAARTDGEARGAKALAAYALTNEAHTLLLLGDPEKARAAFTDARTRFQELGDSGASADALLGLSAIEDAARDPAQVEAWLAEALTLFREARDREGEALALNNLAASIGERGDIDKHLQLLKDALSISREIRDDAAIATTAQNLALGLAFNGALEPARAYVLEAMTAVRASADPLDTAWCLASQAQIETVAGNLRDARRGVDEATALLRGSSALETRSYVSQTRGEVLFAAGAIDESLALFEEAGRSTPGGAQHWPTVGAARALLALGRDVDPAPLLALRDQEADPPVMLEVHVYAAEALLKRGDVDAAAVELESARSVVSGRPGLTFRSSVDALDARLRAARGDTEGAVAAAERAADDARGLGALAYALEHELLLAELGDQSRLEATRADAERLGFAHIAARADAISRRPQAR